MNEQELSREAEVQAYEAWYRDQRSKKRRAAAVVVAALVAGFVAAALVGHFHPVEPPSAQATNAAAR